MHPWQTAVIAQMHVEELKREAQARRTVVNTHAPGPARRALGTWLVRTGRRIAAQPVAAGARS